MILDSFLKDIPPGMSCKLVRQMNVPDTLGNDWRGVADCLNITYEQMLESGGKMGDMLDIMVQQNYRIKDLLIILKRIKRYDVVELFTSNEKWLRMEEKAVQTEGMLFFYVSSLSLFGVILTNCYAGFTHFFRKKKIKPRVLKYDVGDEYER